MRGVVGSLVRAVLVTALAAGCVGPARAESHYLADMVNSAQAVVSSLETARLTVDAVAQGRSTAAYSSLQLSEAETDAEWVVTSFSSVQPPSPELDAARAELITTMQDATALLGELRLAAFRDRSEQLPQIADGIAPIRDRLEQIARQAKP